MKIKRLETLNRRMREYHRRNPWRLNRDGLFIPHIHDDQKPPIWCDIGFIQGGRRVMIWWVHPRCAYQEAIRDEAYRIVPAPSEPTKWIEEKNPIYKTAGRSRKRIVGYRAEPWTNVDIEHSQNLEVEENRLLAESSLRILPYARIKRMDWAIGIELCVPIEIKDESSGYVALANLARRLVCHRTTIQREYPNYSYGREEWVAEQEKQEILTFIEAAAADIEGWKA